MTPRLSLTIASLLLCSSALAAPTKPMTDFQRFTSYPFMERGYREAQKDNWAEVERLTRHVLGRVPNNNEARALLAEALAHQRRYKEAEAIAEDLDDNPEHADALLELRLTWIEQDPPAASQVEAWLADSQGQQRVRLWQAYSVSLAKFGGAAKALEWLNHLPVRDDGMVLRMTRANFAEQLRNWGETIDQLQPLADQGQLPPQDWQRLANAYIQQLDEKGLNSLLASAPSQDAATRARLAMANRAIAMGHNQQAERWLQSLPAEQLQHPEQRQQLWELAREGDDAPLVRQLSNELQRPCLETVDWLSHKDLKLAREQLGQCQARDNPRSYAILRQRLYGDPAQPAQPRTAHRGAVGATLPTDWRSRRPGTSQLHAARKRPERARPAAARQRLRASSGQADALAAATPGQPLRTQRRPAGQSAHACPGATSRCRHPWPATGPPGRSRPVRRRAQGHPGHPGRSRAVSRPGALRHA